MHRSALLCANAFEGSIYNNVLFTFTVIDTLRLQRLSSYLYRSASTRSALPLLCTVLGLNAARCCPSVEDS